MLARNRRVKIGLQVPDDEAGKLAISAQNVASHLGMHSFNIGDLTWLFRTEN